MKSILIAGIITAYLFTAKDPQATLLLQYKTYMMAQQLDPNGIDKLKKRILDDEKKLPSAAKQFLYKNIAWEFFAKSTLNSYWGNLNDKQKKEFTKALRYSMLKRYAKYFSPDKKFSVKFYKPTDYRSLRGERFAKVTSIISSTSNEAEAAVDFIFVFKDKHWMLCDIYVEGVSKSRSYRFTIRKIYKKYGYSGIMSKLKAKSRKLKKVS